MATISYARHRFPAVVIRHAVWLYFRFTLSYRTVEDLLAERGLDVSYETVRRWVLKFGPLFARELRLRRNAAHPVNAILNYAYAVLETEIRIKAISKGYDPTIGIMHEGDDGSSKFIFDLMEPERPNID